MLTALREVQAPLLAAMLLGACSAKLARVLRARSMEVGLGPTALFPLHLRRPVAMGMCATETALGIALIVTAGRFGTGLPAIAVRGATAVLFVTASGALIELRQRRPDVGCGCFGDLSSTPVSLRTIARSVLLFGAALLSIGAAPIKLPPPGAALALRLLLLVAELGVIGALSPEIGAALVRLGYSEPCELRVLPSSRSISALHSSRQWRKHAIVLTGGHPVDVWRELCWRYLVYPGRYDGLDVEVVFAVYLRARRPPIRAAIVDTATGAVLPPPSALPQVQGRPGRAVPVGPVGPLGGPGPVGPLGAGRPGSAVHSPPAARPSAGTHSSPVARPPGDPGAAFLPAAVHADGEWPRGEPALLHPRESSRFL